MDRHARILEILSSRGQPITGSELAGRLGVSRQVVVQSVAVLRAQGHPVRSTPAGYELEGAQPEVRARAVLAVCHGPERTGEELHALVDVGLRVLDVIVEHPLYGEIRGLLLLKDHAQVDRFLERYRTEQFALLSSLTRGVHLHTVEAAHPDQFLEGRARLRALGILVER